MYDEKLIVVDIKKTSMSFHRGSVVLYYIVIGNYNYQWFFQLRHNSTYFTTSQSPTTVQNNMLLNVTTCNDMRDIYYIH